MDRISPQGRSATHTTHTTHTARSAPTARGNATHPTAVALVDAARAGDGPRACQLATNHPQALTQALCICVQGDTKADHDDFALLALLLLERDEKALIQGTPQLVQLLHAGARSGDAQVLARATDCALTYCMLMDQPTAYDAVVLWRLRLQGNASAEAVAADLGECIREALTHRIEGLRDALEQRSRSALKPLRKQAGSPPGQGADFRLYGGAAGNALFRATSQQVAVPLVAQLATALREQIAQAPAQERAALKAIYTRGVLDPLLAELGDLRGTLARDSGSKEAERFGAPFEPGRAMLDPVESYPAWRAHIDGLARDTLRSAVRTLQGGAQGTGAIAWSADEAATRDEFVIGGRPGNRCGEFVLHLPPGSGAILADWPLKAIDTMALREIDCYHEGPASLPRERLAAHLMDAMLRELPREEQAFKQDLLGILMCIAPASLFKAGQSSVHEWLQQGLAASHGLRVVLPPDWQPHPQRGTLTQDIRALSAFDNAAFEREFMAAVTLEPLPPTVPPGGLRV